jgi:hypothetical protein
MLQHDGRWICWFEYPIKYSTQVRRPGLEGFENILLVRDAEMARRFITIVWPNLFLCTKDVSMAIKIIRKLFVQISRAGCRNNVYLPNQRNSRSCLVTIYVPMPPVRRWPSVRRGFPEATIDYAIKPVRRLEVLCTI